jgi:TolB-like protein
MKRGFFFAFLFWLGGVCVFSQTTVSLGEAIRTASAEIGDRLATGTRIAVLDFRSTSARMSDYAMEEIISALANEGSLIVVGRGRDLELARRELGLNLSGDVSDESALAIGRFLGAQMVASGSLSIAGPVYRFGVRVLDVETGVIRYDRSQNVLNDSLVATLMGGEALVTNFTGGERAGAAILNLALGLGSFVIQKDPLGGGVTAALEAAGAAAVIVSFFQVKESWVYNPWTDNQEIERDTSVSTPVLIGGLAAYAGGVVFGAIRAFSYRKPGVNVADSGYFSPWNIALVPTSDRNITLRLGYTLRF